MDWNSHWTLLSEKKLVEARQKTCFGVLITEGGRSRERVRTEAKEGSRTRKRSAPTAKSPVVIILIICKNSSGEIYCFQNHLFTVTVFFTSCNTSRN